MDPNSRLVVIVEALVNACKTTVPFEEYVTVSGFLSIGADGDAKKQELVVLNELIGPAENYWSDSFYLEPMRLPMGNQTINQSKKCRKNNSVMAGGRKTSQRDKRESFADNSSLKANNWNLPRTNVANQTFIVEDKSTGRPIGPSISSSTVIIQSPSTTSQRSKKRDNSSPSSVSENLSVSRQTLNVECHQRIINGALGRWWVKQKHPAHFQKPKSRKKWDNPSQYPPPTNYVSALSLRCGCNELELSNPSGSKGRGNKERISNTDPDHCSEEEVSIADTKQPFDLVQHFDELNAVEPASANKSSPQKRNRNENVIPLDLSQSCLVSDSCSNSGSNHLQKPTRYHDMRKYDKTKCRWSSASSPVDSRPDRGKSSFDKQKLSIVAMSEVDTASTSAECVESKKNAKQTRKRNRRRKRKVLSLLAANLTEDPSRPRSSVEEYVHSRSEQCLDNCSPEDEHDCRSIGSRHSKEMLESRDVQPTTSHSRISVLLNSVVQALRNTGLYNQNQYTRMYQQHDTLQPSVQMPSEDCSSREDRKPSISH